MAIDILLLCGRAPKSHGEDILSVSIRAQHGPPQKTIHRTEKIPKDPEQLKDRSKVCVLVHHKGAARNKTQKKLIYVLWPFGTETNRTEPSHPFIESPSELGYTYFRSMPLRLHAEFAILAGAHVIDNSNIPGQSPLWVAVLIYLACLTILNMDQVRIPLPLRVGPLF